MKINEVKRLEVDAFFQKVGAFTLMISGFIMMLFLWPAWIFMSIKRKLNKTIVISKGFRNYHGKEIEDKLKNINNEDMPNL